MKYLTLIVYILLFHLSSSSYSLDKSSLSNLEDIKQKQINLKLKVDFKEKRLFGKAKIIMHVLKEGLSYIKLDSESLDIYSIELNGLKVKFSEINDSKDKSPLGQGIFIETKYPLKKHSTIVLIIKYSTTKNSSSLHFVEPQETLGKNYWFVYSQCSAILCRSLFPSQDSPSRKALFKAELQVEKPYKALFSGIRYKKRKLSSKKTIYKYTTKKIVPTHSIGLAIGKLKSGRLSKRVKIYAERDILKKALKEFEDTEEIISKVEKYLNVPYKFEQYNILVAPKSFPYSAMENVCLTFVHPNMIQGDKSFINVIAHEISHSWTGNLVSIVNWDNFWVKDGFTRFLEMKVMEKMKGKKYVQLVDYIKNKNLHYFIKNIGIKSKMSKLNPKLSDINPDLYFSSVPYDKGYMFLKHLENLVGKRIFRKIFGKYIRKYKYKSVNYHHFIRVYQNMVKKLYSSNNYKKILNRMKLEKWVNGSGYPPSRVIENPKFIKNLKKKSNKLFKLKYLPKKIVTSYFDWNFHKKRYFLSLIFRNKKFYSGNGYLNILKKKIFDKEKNRNLQKLFFLIRIRVKNRISRKNIFNYLRNYLRLGNVTHLYNTVPKKRIKLIEHFIREHRKLYHPATYRKLKLFLKS